MDLGSLTRPDLVFTDLPATDRLQALNSLAGRIAARGLVRDAEELFQKLWEREQLGSTGIGGGVAIPHCKVPGLAGVAVAVGVAPEGIDFGAVDGRPVHLFFVVLSSGEAPAEHLQALAAISRWVRGGRRSEEILALGEPQAIYDLLRKEGG